MATSPLHARLGGFFLLLITLLLDQWSKAAILSAAAAARIPYEVLPVFNLVLVRNHGISFGLFSQSAPWMPGLLTLATSCIAMVLAVWLARAHGVLTPLALGLIIGGAAGNIIDRLRLGAVTDFLDFHWQHYHWPAFNVADSAIFMGVVILIFIGIVKPPKEDA